MVVDKLRLVLRRCRYTPAYLFDVNPMTITFAVTHHSYQTK